MTVLMTQTPPPLPPVPQPVPGPDPSGQHATARPLSPDGFDVQVDLQLAACRRHGVKTGVIFLRLDNLRALGIEHGCDMLQAMGDVVRRRLISRLRRVDRCAQVDADTFGVALFDARPDVMPSIENRLRDELARPVRLGELLLTLQVQAGSAIGHRIGTTADDLIRRAAAGSMR